ncbi:TetR/AcrR family transcriptional regulator [Allohahella sp. A8]|uniref:TetR/AcrR family transcriptional regulator n=1 Tax=Allohahella sp. A8 TaxID=3141461 RepID=UPI003A7F6F97
MAGMKTRERIAMASLSLFNHFGEPNVTTLQIADELNISPGNLYYHFKNKTEIINDLFGRFERQMLNLISAPDAEVSIDDYWIVLHLVFECIAEYQFLYKDLVNILQRYERIAPRFRKILNRKLAVTHSVLQRLKERHVIDAADSELAALAHNVVLTLTWWPSYDVVTAKLPQEMDLNRGIAQTISQVAPYLREAERAEVLALSREYLATAPGGSPEREV